MLDIYVQNTHKIRADNRATLHPGVKVKLQDLIPELRLSQKRHTHMGPVRNGSGVVSF
jgi:hypothetical protein